MSCIERNLVRWTNKKWNKIGKDKGAIVQYHDKCAKRNKNAIDLVKYNPLYVPGSQQEEKEGQVAVGKVHWEDEEKGKEEVCEIWSESANRGRR